MELFHMADIIELLGLPPPPANRSNYNIACPCCDTEPYKKHLNINLQKDVFRCPRCGFAGGVFDLYAHYSGIPRKNVRETLLARLNVQGVEAKEPRTPPPVIEECPPTDIDTRHATYTALLGKLSLASDHRENLLQRGLTQQEIERLGYKTTPVVGTTTLAKQLQDEGHYLSGVPGFFRNNSGQWSFVHGWRGIMIPVRDLSGRIQGIQVRRDNATRRKFRWISTAGAKDGCHAENWIHVAGNPTKSVILTEGPMKADIVHFFTGQTVVAVAGVNSLNQLPPVLEILQSQGTEQIMTAFDMDFLTNPHVQRGYHNLVSMLGNAGIAYGTYVWDARYKGLDDYMKYLHYNS